MKFVSPYILIFSVHFQRTIEWWKFFEHFFVYLPKINSQLSQPNDRSGITSRSNMFRLFRYFFPSEISQYTKPYKTQSSKSLLKENYFFFGQFSIKFSDLFRFYAALCLNEWKYTLQTTKTLFLLYKSLCVSVFYSHICFYVYVLWVLCCDQLSGISAEWKRWKPYVETFLISKSNGRSKSFSAENLKFYFYVSEWSGYFVQTRCSKLC